MAEHTLVREVVVLASRGSAHLANGHVMWRNVQEVVNEKALGLITNQSDR